MAKHNDDGVKGENEASHYLEKCGYEVVSRNVRYKYGEIDIVARERRRATYKYHFVEVKTVAREKAGTTYHPLQNISREKMNRLKRAVQAYLMGHPEVVDWQFDALCVYLTPSGGVACEMFEGEVL
jgi:putative endonuclease